MKYLTIDGMISGTGVRDTINGGYLPLDRLNIPPELQEIIFLWQQEYEQEHFKQFEHIENNTNLDFDGLNICSLLKDELPDSKVEYYSSAKMRTLSSSISHATK